ncbi:hypothetical protein [Planctobacterium marinum]|uniref:hypothetical protein n=1 Tax=Planctobacterium marinum TaxID=1631968 RepID=UPI001E3365F0|nr:hypothetical protein [Planctobacterium marinum]MCC2604890.1 hypothetical protein [Planctobacterium marinum]
MNDFTILINREELLWITTTATVLLSGVELQCILLTLAKLFCQQVCPTLKNNRFFKVGIA